MLVNTAPLKTINTELNVLLVDDEENACINLRNLLSNYIEEPLNILGMANSTTEAEHLIAQLKPNIVFLDIDMQTENAFHFLSRIAPVDFEIVFVTAYDEYAVRAFRLNAVDYILKPIDIDELRAAVQKTKIRLQANLIKRNEYDALAAMVNNDHRPEPNKIIIRSSNHIEIVDFNDLVFISAVSNYSKITFRKKGEEKDMIVSNTLMEYEDLLPKHIFFRIHRSFLVNKSFITGIINGAHGHEVEVAARKLPISRRRYLQLTEFLKYDQ